MLKPLLKRKNDNCLHWVFMVALFVLGTSGVSAQELRSERVVVVQPGETLSEIVEREMRSSAYWPAVARHNNIQNAALIKAGQTIRIPLTYTRSNEQAIVLFVKGEAQLRARRPEGDSELQRGDIIHVGDQIRTGRDGFVSVEFSSGSIVNVQPDSHISVVNVSCEVQQENCIIELYAEKGSVQSRVNQRPDQPVDFRIETPSGSAAVRGTVFDIDTSSAKSATAVLNGKVDMLAEGVTAGVDGGFGVVARAGSAPDVPRALLDPPAIVEMPRRLAKGDAIYWWDNQEAAAYNVVISKDQAATAVENMALTSGSEFKVPLDMQGHYYINVRSIDAHGLKGMPTTIPVELVSTLIYSEEPSLAGDLAGDYAAFTLQEGVGGRALTYELQIADNPDFKQPDSYDIDVGSGARVPFSESDGLWARARAVFADFKVSQYSEAVRVSR